MPPEIPFDPELRFRAACAALQGLLADTEDQADEIRTEIRPVEEEYKESIPNNQDPSGYTRVTRTRTVMKKFALETCAEATARLAVEHADALLRALK